MRALTSFEAIFLHKGFVDMRKAINGLSQIIADEMKSNPCDGGLFVFANRSRDILKCIYWDRTGFALWVKRLEKQRFRWPTQLEGETISLTSEELEQLLLGLDIVAARPHETLHFSHLS